MQRTVGLAEDDDASREDHATLLQARVEFLEVRIETLLQRRQALLGTDDDRHTQLVVGPLAIDLQCGAVAWKGHLVDLSLPHYWMVLELASAPCKARSVKELMAAAHIKVAPNTIAAHIRSIRARFRAIDAQFNAIRTERGLGYRWSSRVKGGT